MAAYLDGERPAAAAAGLGHIHPHQLRHTLATQAINRGMSLEAIAALLGHHSLDMTLRYAKIANRRRCSSISASRGSIFGFIASIGQREHASLN
ncbi:tyrosine-type recombinase/integrase [Kibdelosporangium aridum]|uniref:tyrosine-type recombinase/integrase n=1 Tax=Kibdelosporangium aridum TaxID=2030 RepID=UPI0035EF5A47